MKVIPQPVDLLRDVLSCREVSKKIPSISHMNVSRILKAESGIPRIKAGRPQRLPEINKRKVIRDISSGKTENAVLAARELSGVTGRTVHPENVRSVRRKAGLKSIKKKRSRFSLPVGQLKISRE